MIPWKYTIVVFSRDISILLISGVLFMIAGLRDFRPSIFGKANTFSQVAAIFFVLLLLVEPVRWISIACITFLRATFIFTIVSAVHYAFLVQHGSECPRQTPRSILRPSSARHCGPFYAPLSGMRKRAVIKVPALRMRNCHTTVRLIRRKSSESSVILFPRFQSSTLITACLLQSRALRMS